MKPTNPSKYLQQHTQMLLLFLYLCSNSTAAPELRQLCKPCCLTGLFCLSKVHRRTLAKEDRVLSLEDASFGFMQSQGLCVAEERSVSRHSSDAAEAPRLSRRPSKLEADDGSDYRYSHSDI